MLVLRKDSLLGLCKIRISECTHSNADKTRMTRGLPENVRATVVAEVKCYWEAAAGVSREGLGFTLLDVDIAPVVKHSDAESTARSTLAV